MAYRVSLAAPAEADTYAAFERIRAADPLHAEKWRLGAGSVCIDPTIDLCFTVVLR
jgi:hypothetical protein